jgi:hypothetical protein
MVSFPDNPVTGFHFLTLQSWTSCSGCRLAHSIESYLPNIVCTPPPQVWGMKYRRLSFGNLVTTPRPPPPRLEIWLSPDTLYLQLQRFQGARFNILFDEASPASLFMVPSGFQRVLHRPAFFFRRIRICFKEIVQLFLNQDLVLMMINYHNHIVTYLYILILVLSCTLIFKQLFGAQIFVVEFLHESSREVAFSWHNPSRKILPQYLKQ